MPATTRLDDGAESIISHFFSIPHRSDFFPLIPFIVVDTQYDSLYACYSGCDGIQVEKSVFDFNEHDEAQQ